MRRRWFSPGSLVALLSVLLLLSLGAVRTETRSSQTQSPEWHWTDVRRVVAFGDVHGAIDELEALLRATEVIDVAGHWTSGTYGRWLLLRPVLVVIDDTAFVHGGLSPELAELGGAEINRLVLEELHGYLSARQELQDAGLLAWEARRRRAGRIRRETIRIKTVPKSRDSLLRRLRKP